MTRNTRKNSGIGDRGSVIATGFRRNPARTPKPESRTPTTGVPVKARRARSRTAAAHKQLKGERTAPPPAVPDWQTTVQAYWQTVPPKHANTVLANLEHVPAIRDTKMKLLLITQSLRDMCMDTVAVVDVILAASAGLPEEGLLDAVAAKIRSVL
jgi:hypothetical protein